jgi:hypothetical protein
MTNELPMKILCINDKNQPKEIPLEKQVAEGKIYTLINAQFLLSSNSLGFELAEIKLDESCFPYHYFNPDRFVPIDEKEMEEIDAELDEILNPKLV